MVQNGFSDMQTRFATKEDLKGLVTKKDAERFATKEDLEQFATKDDFRVLVDELRLLRDDVKDIGMSLRSLASVVGGHERDILTLKRQVEV